MKENDRKRRILILLFILAILAAAYFVSANLYQLMLVHGSSMEPAYRDKEIVLIDKHDREYQKGEATAVYCEKLSSVIVKRIAAVPGDEVIIRDGRLYINGKISESFKDSCFEYSGILSDTLLLDSDEFIVIGDNVSESHDSRYEDVGIIKRNCIIGTIIQGF